MRKRIIFLMVFFTTMAACVSLKAQEVTITLQPGWNWISYPNFLPMRSNEALEDFVPMEGDIIKSRYGVTLYHHGRWIGSLTQFIPGQGLQYYSSRSEIVSFSFAKPVTTLVAIDMITNISAMSAVVCSNVILLEGNNVFLRGLCWSTNPTPDFDTNHTLDGWGVGSFSSTLEGLTPNTTYYVRAYAVTDFGISYGEEVSFTTLDAVGVDEHGYVDLGLPSGTLWATCNVGASAPEDYGDYFAWGETQPKDIYNWSTYLHCNGSQFSLTKYCINPSYGYNGYVDLLFSLEPEDDAAVVNWGYGWRMPSREEWQELYENTTHTWTTLNGVNGRLFTASNGNSIFLPAAGYRHDASHYNVGNSGFYWANNLDLVRSNNGWYFCFDSNYYYTNCYYRRYGSSVRPVRSAQ